VVVGLLDGAHEADITLLDQVEQRQAVADILLGDADHQPQIRLDQLAARRLAVGDGGREGRAQLRAEVLGRGQPARRGVAALHPHGQFDLLGGAEQRDVPDLLQIVLDRVERRRLGLRFVHAR